MRLVAVLLLLAAGAAHAEPRPAGPAGDPALRDADRLLAKGRTAAAIAGLRRAIAADDRPARRCALDLAYAAHLQAPLDLSRADLHLPACASVDDPAVVTRARAARIRVDRALRASDLSPIEIAARPGLVVTVDTLPGDRFVTPAKIWLPAGRHLFATAGASAAVAVKDGNRALVTLEPPPAPAPATAGSVDFTDEAPAAAHTGAPPPVKRDSLLPERYRKGLRARPRRP